MLMMDSVTRFAMAQREVGLAIGEPPATRGYTPSCSRCCRACSSAPARARRGSITGLYTVLVDGDDMNEPIADAVRSILDGHVVLTRSLAHAGHYPAIDVLQSVSRLIGEIVTARGPRRRHAAARGARRLPREGGPDLDRRLPARHRPGARRRDRRCARAIDAFLRQRVDEPSIVDEADAQLLGARPHELARRMPVAGRGARRPPRGGRRR